MGPGDNAVPPSGTDTCTAIRTYIQTYKHADVHINEHAYNRITGVLESLEPWKLKIELELPKRMFRPRHRSHGVFWGSLICL